ncbi:MAG: hypothetical protein HOW97_09865 [Catenulispora sp.]|nr:hypothetical protein [Catenulispora sp.]
MTQPPQEPVTTVPYTRIEATVDGGCRFVDAAIAAVPRLVATGVPPMLVGALPSAGGVAYLRSEGFDSVPHPAPAVQWVVMLRGTVEVTVSTGEARRFSPGDLLLAADVTGVGHRSAGVGAAPFECLFIPVDPSWDVLALKG